MQTRLRHYGDARYHSGSSSWTIPGYEVRVWVVDNDGFDIILPNPLDFIGGGDFLAGRPCIYLFNDIVAGSTVKNHIGATVGTLSGEDAAMIMLYGIVGIAPLWHMVVTESNI